QNEAACCLGIFTCNECGCCEEGCCDGCDGCCDDAGRQFSSVSEMSDSPSSSSDQQFITQQPLPQETEDPKRSTENAGDSVCTECAACCGECCMETGQTSHECSTACCIGVFACNECGCWEQCCNCCC
ncbi:hypothetical protein PENTCL1PPCAC_12378, partial [Pristionchus entomophagus]